MLHGNTDGPGDDLASSLVVGGAQGDTAPRATDGHGRDRPKKKKRNPIVAYLSCLCPPDTSDEVAEEAAALRRAALAENAGVPGNNSMTPAPPATSSKPNWFLLLLLREHYTDGSLIALKTDIFSGITLAVAQVAPSVAFAIMGHGQPLVGLFSSFFLGIICCIFGGRPGQVTAIAGAVVVLYPDLVDKHGYGAACAVSIIAGCFILLTGIFRVAGLVRLLPSSLMLGFCNGLGLSMVVNQIPQFKDEHGDFVTGMRAFKTAVICVISYAIMMLLPYFTTAIPSAFVAILVGTAIEYIFSMNTVTIGDLYELRGDFPKPRVPDMDWGDSESIKDVMVAAILTAIISSIESFMAGYKMQQLTETSTNFEREALALGAAHIVNGFFDGMSGCVVYGPCILNVECGSGTRRLSSLICAVLMVIIPVALYTVIGIIPMGALSAVLFGVSSKTADWRMLAMIFLQRVSFQESVVALLVTVVTVIEDLAIGAAAGFAAALVFFMWNMSRGRVSMTPVQNSAPYSIALEYSTAAMETATFRLGAATATTTAAAAHREGGAAAHAPHAKRPRRQEPVLMVAREVSVPAAGDGAERGNVTELPSVLTKMASDMEPVQDTQERSSTLTLLRAAGAAPAFQKETKEETAAFSGAKTNGSMDLDSDTFDVATDAPDDNDNDNYDTINNNGADVLVAPDRSSSSGGLHRANTYSVSLEPPRTEGAPLLGRSMVRNPTNMIVNFLDIKRDPDFPEIKVLRIKMNGVLFFGSCMDFVGGMIRLLHDHHSEIFLKVTDIILDFQHGMMPVMDFSSAEAIEDVARIFYKRGIHTHARNLDPLSWTCFERCRRYFPTVSEDNVNNVKNFCYARRIFKIKSRQTQDGEGGDGGGGGGGDRLDDDVFVRANRSFTTTRVTLPPPAGISGAAAAVVFGEQDTRTFFNPDAEEEGEEDDEPAAATAGPRSSFSAASATVSVDINGTVVPPPRAEMAFEDAVGVYMTATEEQVPFVDSIKVGFPIYRPYFGITVVVFDTVAGWSARKCAAQAEGLVSPLALGLTEKKPLNRQFCEFGRVWWQRLFNKDVPRPAQLGSLPEEPPLPIHPQHSTAAPPSSSSPLSGGRILRPAPTEFRQVPRFAGQGFAKGERLKRREWSLIKAQVLRTLFDATPPKEPNRFAARLRKFEVDLVSGFI